MALIYPLVAHRLNLRERGAFMDLVNQPGFIRIIRYSHRFFCDANRPGSRVYSARGFFQFRGQVEIREIEHGGNLVFVKLHQIQDGGLFSEDEV